MKPISSSVPGFTLVELMIVVTIISLLAAMALPAFNRIRQSAQDKAVLNNARQLSSAADQYFLESGNSTVAIDDIVGPSNYVKALNLIAHESYPDSFTQGTTLTISQTAAASRISLGNRPCHRIEFRTLANCRDSLNRSAMAASTRLHSASQYLIAA